MIGQIMGIEPHRLFNKVNSFLRLTGIDQRISHSHIAFGVIGIKGDSPLCFGDGLLGIKQNSKPF